MSFATLQPIIASAPKRATPERLRLTKAALAILALLPFVSFGDLLPDDYLVDVYPYRFTASGAFNSTSSYLYDINAHNVPVSFLREYFFNFPFGVKISSAGSLSYPSLDPTHANSLTNATKTEYFNIKCLNDSSWYSLLKVCPEVRTYASICSRLFLLGYRGDGIGSIYTNSNSIITFNVTPVRVFSDVVGSTNTVYRRVLLDALASIGSSVQNIDINVSGLQSTIQQGNDDIVDALIGDYPEIQESLKKGDSRAVDVRTSIKSQLQAWRNQATQQLNVWKSDLKSDLQAWKTSDETGILNIRQHIQDVTTAVDSMKNQFGTTDPQGNSVSFSAFTTNFVTVPITNVVTQSGNEISSNIQQAADMLDDRLYDLWDRFYNTAGAWDSEGINVRIVQPTDGDNHVLVKDDAVLRVLEDGVTFVSPELTQISDAWDSFLASYSPTNSLDWEPWFSKWVPFSETVTNYYAEFNASAPASDIAADFLERGFDADRYSALPWFERVEVLLAMIADVRSNAVEVADIQEAMEEQVTNFQALSTNVVSVSSDVVGLFQYVQRFSTSLQSVFGDSAAPLTGDYVLLPAGHWIGDTPLVLRVNPTIQNFCRLIMQCIWYLGFLVLLWVVVNWVWSKVVAVLRWLWSMFDV